MIDATPEPVILTLRETAEKLGVDERTVRRWGVVRECRHPMAKTFYWPDVLAYLRQSRFSTNQPRGTS